MRALPKKYTIYPNTPELSVKIGWVFVPEYCCGNQTWPWVKHDTDSGIFIFQETK